jgi:hypothetical protein
MLSQSQRYLTTADGSIFATILFDRSAQHQMYDTESLVRTRINARSTQTNGIR